MKNVRGPNVAVNPPPWIDRVRLIAFEDHGQDFLEWFVARNRVVDSRPFQAGLWIGTLVLNPDASPGEYLAVHLKHDNDSRLTKIKYPVAGAANDDVRRICCTAVEYALHELSACDDILTLHACITYETERPYSPRGPRQLLIDALSRRIEELEAELFAGCQT